MIDALLLVFDIGAMLILLVWSAKRDGSEGPPPQSEPLKRT